MHSIDRLMQILELAHECGVHCAPALLGDPAVGDGCAVVPLQSWYHSHFLTPRGATPRAPGAGERETAMMDGAVVWPAFLNDSTRSGFDERRCRFFADLNRQTLHDVAPLSEAAAAEQRFFGREPPPPLLRGWPVVSFSHFLPRPELHRGFRWLEHFEGSHHLGDQVAQLHAGAASSVHVYGHTHFSMDDTYDGIRYVQHPLGNPHERANGWQISSTMRHPSHASLKPVWQSSRPRVADSSPVDGPLSQRGLVDGLINCVSGPAQNRVGIFH